MLTISNRGIKAWQSFILKLASVPAPARVGDTLGYARVSTHDQNPDAQSDRLIEAGAIRVFTDIVSGKRFDRPRPGRAH